MAKNKSTNKENSTNGASKTSGQPSGKAPGKKMTIEEKKLQLTKALEKLEKQEREAKQLEEKEMMRLKELESLVPTLIPTVADNYNLNKRILADVYLKELSHHIFLVWSDSLYGQKPINLQVIQAAINFLILAGQKFELGAESVFIMAIQTKTRFQPLGSCFVLLPKDKVGEDETEILHRIVKHRSRMVLVDKLMFVKHMKLKHLLIFSSGYRDLVKTIPAPAIRALKPVGVQADHIKDHTKDRSSAGVAQQVAISKVKSPTLEPKPVEQIEWTEKESSTGQKDNTNEQAVTSDDPETSTSQSVSEESDEDDCQIVGAPIVTQPPRAIDAPVGFGVREFIPVTEETVSKALALMSQYESQGRAVAIVFDSCFFVETIDMDIIRAKFKDIFGDIDHNQVLIRINSPKLASNLDEAEKLGVKALNQAYIIAQQGLTDNDVNRRAAARNVFCCPMTLGCVVKNLNRGVFMMHKNTFEGRDQVQVSETVAAQQKRSIASESDNITDLVNTSTKSNGSVNGKGSFSSVVKRNRIAASLGTTAEGPGQMEHQDKDRAEPLAIKKSASIEKIPMSDADKELLKDIMRHGDTIISVNNLPPKLSVLALNLMLGTFTLKPEQVIASIKQAKGNQDLMDVMIVIKKTSQDVERILSKNGFKTCHNSIVVAKLTSPLKLSRFIRSRDNIHKMDANMNLPVNKIGYSTESR